MSPDTLYLLEIIRHIIGAVIFGELAIIMSLLTYVLVSEKEYEYSCLIHDLRYIGEAYTIIFYIGLSWAFAVAAALIMSGIGFVLELLSGFML